MVQHVSIRLKDRNTVEVVVDGNKIDGISYYKKESDYIDCEVKRIQSKRWISNGQL